MIYILLTPIYFRKKSDEELCEIQSYFQLYLVFPTEGICPPHFNHCNNTASFNSFRVFHNDSDFYRDEYLIGSHCHSHKPKPISKQHICRIKQPGQPARPWTVLYHYLAIATILRSKYLNRTKSMG